MNTVDVEQSKLPLVLAVIVGTMFSLLAFGLAADALTRGTFTPLAIAIVLILSYGALAWIVLRGNQHAVRSLSDDGLLRNDGELLDWADLDRVVDRIHQDEDGKRLWRTEIHFRGGESAWIIPQKVKNYEELSGAVRTLPCERVEEPA